MPDRVRWPPVLITKERSIELVSTGPFLAGTAIVIIKYSKLQRIFNCLCLGSAEDTEPIYTNGRVYFNMTGEVCRKDTNEKYNLNVILTCDYSSSTANPVILMPYVSFCSPLDVRIDPESFAESFSHLRRTTNSASWWYSTRRDLHAIRWPDQWIRIRAPREIHKPATFSTWCRWANTITKFHLRIEHFWSTYANRHFTLSMKCVRRAAVFAWSTPKRKIWLRSRCDGGKLDILFTNNSLSGSKITD